MKAIQFSILLVLLFFINCDFKFNCFSYFEAMMDINCKNTFSNDTHGCLYTGNKCELRQKGCNSYKGTNESICASIIPTGHIGDNEYKCAIQGDSCKDTLKECSDYEEGLNDCESLDPKGENKRCVLNNGKCESHFNKCNLLGTNQQTCEANIPKDKSHECVWEGNACQEKTKKCEGTKFYTDDDCFSLTVSDSEKKKCLGSDDGCKEQYKTCELYNEKPSDKNKEECESLRFNDKGGYNINYKCVYKENQCSTGTKCSDFTYKSGCNDFTPSDTDKICSFINGVCKEIYKSCELYDTKTLSENKNEADCKETIEYNNLKYKCVFDENKNCKKQELTKCSDYESWMEEDYCNNIVLNKYKKCVFKDNKCTEIFTGCPEKTEEISKENCEAIKLNVDYYVCRYDESDKGCYQKDKDCSIGEDESTCKSIILYEKYEDGVKKNTKCVWEDKGCVEKPKECEDAKNAKECGTIDLTLSGKNDKKCIYLNGQCKEQYKDCASYNNNGKEAIEQSVCESIVIISNDLNDYKCVFKSGTTNQCVRELKYSSCSEFKKDDYENECASIFSSSSFSYDIVSPENKCVYSNSICSEVKKTCLELSNESVGEEICENAPTSGSNKYCSLKADESGCEEKEKENENKGTFYLSDQKLWFNLLVILFGLLL